MEIMTDSMKEAIDETNRRRKIQHQYNIDNGIDPKTVIREISEDIINLDYGLPEDMIKEREKKVIHFQKRILKKRYLNFKKRLQSFQRS